MTDSSGDSSRTLLSPSALALVRPDAPRAARLAAARGEAPLGAADRLATLAVLAADRDADVRQAARDRLARGPVAGLLDGIGPETDPRILDLLARARGTDRSVADVLLRHPRVPDAALARLATAQPTALLEAVQDRTVPRPHRARIAGAMTRAEGVGASSALQAAPQSSDAAELSDAEAEALVARMQSGEIDPEFDEILTRESDEAVVEESPQHENVYRQILAMSVSQKIQLAFKGNKEARSILVKDPNKLVCGAVVKSPKVNETEVIAYANSRNLSSDVFRAIAVNKDFMKLYAIRLALAGNPRVPNDVAIRCLNTLQDKDVATIARSKNVSSAISTAARRMVHANAERQKKREQQLMGGGH